MITDFNRTSQFSFSYVNYYHYNDIDGNHVDDDMVPTMVRIISNVDVTDCIYEGIPSTSILLFFNYGSYYNSSNFRNYNDLRIPIGGNDPFASSTAYNIAKNTEELAFNTVNDLYIGHDHVDIKSTEINN
jgi:hypothetical protein